MLELGLNRESALWSASIAAVAACMISTTTIYNHLNNFSQPALQKCIIRILLMAPLFACTSFCAILFRSYHLVFATIRDCYEGYVLFQFFTLLMGYLGGENNVAFLLENKGPLSPKPPCCFCPTINLSRDFLLRCNRFILQYVWITPMLAISGFTLGLLGVYKEGQWTLDSPFAYMSVVKTVSTMSAMFHLVQFYRAFADELAPHKPLGKFACIKIVLFISFWLRILFSILVFTDVLKNANIQSFLKDFFMCLEMLFISILHSHVYSYREYVDEEIEHTSFQMIRNFFRTVAPKDVWEESVHSFRRRDTGEHCLNNFLSLPEEEREQKIVRAEWGDIETIKTKSLQKRFLILVDNGILFVLNTDPFQKREFGERMVFDEELTKIRSVVMIELKKNQKNISS